jgi:hypothetical protein
MDHERLFLTAAIAASVALGSPRANASEAYPGLEARVQAIAEQGPGALRQFIFRTRMIYALHYEDYAPAERDAVDADPGPQGFWAGVPGFEADPASWMETAAYPPADAQAGRDQP